MIELVTCVGFILFIVVVIFGSVHMNNRNKINVVDRTTIRRVNFRENINSNRKNRY